MAKKRPKRGHKLLGNDTPNRWMDGLCAKLNGCGGEVYYIESQKNDNANHISLIVTEDIDGRVKRHEDVARIENFWRTINRCSRFELFKVEVVLSANVSLGIQSSKRSYRVNSDGRLASDKIAAFVGQRVREMEKSF